MCTMFCVYQVNETTTITENNDNISLNYLFAYY
jgi:hypothetical protein